MAVARTGAGGGRGEMLGEAGQLWLITGGMWANASSMPTDGFTAVSVGAERLALVRQQVSPVAGALEVGHGK